MSGTVHLLLLYVFTAWTVKTLLFICTSTTAGVKKPPVLDTRHVCSLSYTLFIHDNLLSDNYLATSFELEGAWGSVVVKALRC